MMLSSIQWGWRPPLATPPQKSFVVAFVVKIDFQVQIREKI